MDCEFMSSDFKRITKHVVKHISEGHPVFCPLKCRTGKPFATPNSLRIHNMYFHRIGVPRNLSRPDVSQPKYGSTDQVCAPHPEVTVCNTYVEDVGKADQEEKTEIEQRVELNSNFEMVIGSLLLKLLSKNHVTDVVIQEIVDAMDEALTMEKQFLNFKCKSFASENNGLKYKNSGFFGRKTLNLFFYQDAAEVVVNAVGNATGRHKLECWYMVVGSITLEKNITQILTEQDGCRITTDLVLNVFKDNLLMLLEAEEMWMPVEALNPASDKTGMQTDEPGRISIHPVLGVNISGSNLIKGSRASNPDGPNLNVPSKDKIIPLLLPIPDPPPV
ncbi:AAEL004459-PA [Aedes aegypti]|uniref:AAEL004459-PA n=1 Tax=Aedes aegypti TaxID=7159 RepID=Q17CP0_AEDAE|nr:AAEL004459-PA [Aedes aegypti]